MKSRNTFSNSNSLLRYFNLFIIFMLTYSRHIAEAVQTTAQETDCDFLKELDSRIVPANAYYKNNSYLLSEHQKCLSDNSKEARNIKRQHDAKTISALEEENEGTVVVSVCGGSDMGECDPNWASGVRMGYEYENLGYRVFQGGGAGLMMAVRIGSDLFCRSVEEVETVIALMCEAKTASSDRQQAIKEEIVEQYATCKPKQSLSLHGAFWLTRLPLAPYIGFGSERVEFYDIYSVLSVMAQQSDVFVLAPGGSGTVMEFDATVVQKDYQRYLNPNKKQHAILFNTTAWESNKQVHSERLHRTDLQHAESVEQVVGYTNEFVRENFCSSQSALNTCPAALYQAQKGSHQANVADQTTLTIK